MFHFRMKSQVFLHAGRIVCIAIAMLGARYVIADSIRAGPVEDDTAGKSDICPKHHVQMKKESLPISYGIAVPRPAVPAEIAEKLFPFARQEKSGGCSITPATPMSALVYVCPKCLAEKKRWIASHPNTR